MAFLGFQAAMLLKKGHKTSAGSCFLKHHCDVFCNVPKKHCFISKYIFHIMQMLTFTAEKH